MKGEGEEKGARRESTRMGEESGGEGGDKRVVGKTGQWSGKNRLRGLKKGSKNIKNVYLLKW